MIRQNVMTSQRGKALPIRISDFKKLRLRPARQSHLWRFYHSFQICALLAIILCTAFPAGAGVAPLIENIIFDATGSNVDRITFRLNSSNLPKTFALKSPPRAVFDFPDTDLAKGVKTNIPVTGKFIKGIRTAVHRGDKAKTRVVLDLLTDQSIDFKQDFNAETNTLVISVFALGSKPAQPAPAAAPLAAAKSPEPPVAAAAGKPAPSPGPAKPGATQEPPPAPAKTPAAPAVAPPPTSHPPEPAVASFPKPEAAAEPPGDEGTVIQPLSEIGPKDGAKESSQPPVLYSIEFDKDANQGETINFKLNTFNPPVVFGIEEDTPRIICFFKDTAAGPELQDMIGAKGRFVKSIQVGKYSNPNNVRVVLELVPNKNYDLQQVFFKEDNMFMIIINTNG